MKSFGFIKLRLLTLLFFTACLNAVIAPSAHGVLTLTPVLQGLSSPVYVTNAHDNTNRLFVVERAGRIKVLAAGGTTPTLFMDIASRVLSTGGEQGLLGLAFHPQFATNSRFFVNYTRQTDGATVVAEYHAAADPVATAASESVVLVVAQPFANHNGGMIDFGNDGFLYIGMGDGGSGNDPGNRAQNINELLGKILRIDVDHPAGGNLYSSPAGNPYVGATPGRDEIFAVGMRNPFRFSFDRPTGQLYVGDVGQDALEEIDIVTAGGNYGWRVYEGNNCTGLDPGLCNPANYVAPIAQYGHSGNRCSVTGGYVYRGTAGVLPVGTYVFADFCTGEIFSLVSGAPNLLLDTSLQISSFGEDEAREIYVVGLGGTVHRLAASGASTTTTLGSSGSPAAAGSNVSFTATVVGAVGANPTGNVGFNSDGNAIGGCSPVALTGTGNSKTAVCTTNSLSVGTHSIVASYAGDANNGPSSSTALSQVITGTGGGGSNVALSSAGAVASASSTYTPNFPVSAINNNERTGAGWGNGGGWADGTPGIFPDWVQILFNGSKTIDRVVLYTLQDNYSQPVEPTDSLTFVDHGITAFTVEGWTGSGWTTLASVSNNNLVKRSVTFTPYTTDRIRINVSSARSAWAIITEVEAWETTGSGLPPTTTTLGSSGSPAAAGSNVSFTATVVGAVGANPTGNVGFNSDGNAIGGCSPVALTGNGNSKTAVCTTNSLSVGTHSIVASYAGDANNGPSSSTALSQVITGAGGGGSNVALSSAGAVASASSTYTPNFPVSAINNNERTGAGWGNGGGWADGTPGIFPDWVQILFNGSKTIDRVVLYTLQDNYSQPVEPTDSMTFVDHGITAFTVEGWTGSGWTTLASVSNNNLVKRSVTFTPYTTDRIRINVSSARSAWAIITEVEAWETTGSGLPPTTTTLGSSGSPAAAGSNVSFTATVVGAVGANPTGNVGFNSDGNAIGGCSPVALTGNGNSKTAVCTTNSLSVGTHSIVASYAGDANNGPSSSTALSQVITGAGGGGSNVALSSAGAVASASSTYTPNFPVSAINNNERTGAGWGNGGGWADGTPGIFPDWVQILFNGSKTIDRVVLYTLQDNYSQPVEPTDTLTFVDHGITAFTVEGWTGSGWTTLATVSNNNLVKRSVTFTPYTTDRIRINVSSARSAWAIITEVEAWGTAATGTPTVAWTTFGRDAQHTALSTTASQPLNQIHWQMPVDLQPQYSGGGSLLIHYGSPVITPANTVIVPVKTGATSGFRVEARAGSTGALKWSMTTDYILPAHSWVPALGPALTSQSRLYFPGAGGTIYFRDQADETVGTSGQLAFYGIANYQANPQAYNAGVIINTPLTTDASGNIYFGFLVTGSTPAGLTSGIARISASGQGTWIPVTTASGDPNMTKVPHNSAPALSADLQTLYVAVSNGNSGYLVALDSTTLAPLTRVLLTDPKSGLNGILSDNGSASPTVGTDGDVYFGVLENPFGSNHRRGWLLHFNGSLSQAKTPGAFGWDTTVGLVPAQMVPSYQGTSTYLLMTKYNHYLGQGGDGQNKIAILDPNATQTDPVTTATVMKEVLTKLGPTPETGGGVKEWCINTAAVDPFTKSVLANNEDGKLYRWDLTTNTLSQTVVLTAGLGEAYTSTVIGPDGKVYATNNATLFAVGQ